MVCFRDISKAVSIDKRFWKILFADKVPVFNFIKENSVLKVIYTYTQIILVNKMRTCETE